MENIATKEDLAHVEMIKSRIKAIEHLEKIMRNSSTLEKIFEEHLAEHPWLINPYWNINKNSDSEDKLTTQVYQNTKIAGEFERAFLDILIEVAEEQYPVIVELKKNTPTGHAVVNAGIMTEQIKKYRKAIQQKRTDLKLISDIEIKAVFIITEDAGIIGSGNKIEFETYELAQFKALNIEVLKYNDIIAKSKKMYSEHLQIIKSSNIVPDFDVRLEI